MAGKPKKVGYLAQNGILQFKEIAKRGSEKGKGYVFKIPAPFP
jgi:hypothetical protein